MDYRPLTLVIAAIFWNTVSAIPIDNGVDGEPEISCNANNIAVRFNTLNAFEGHLYVKGRFAEEGCRVSGGSGENGIEMALGFNDCGVARERSLDPQGAFVRVTVVISFHPRVMTKIDRAIQLQCFYMEADKTVSTEIEVSMITTGFQTQFVPMPVCRYEIRRENAEGELLRYALIGEKAYHRWICDTETANTFCMTVHSCYVHDTQGDQQNTIGEDGCAIDAFIVNNIDYVADLEAGVETHVFKFADRNELKFNCQITITVKEPNQDCPRPDCPDLLARRQQRTKRSSSGDNINLVPQPATRRVTFVPHSCFEHNADQRCTDVSTNSLSVLDLPADLFNDDIDTVARAFTQPNHLRFPLKDSASDFDELNSEKYDKMGAFLWTQVCLSNGNLYWIFAGMTVCCVLLTFFLFYAIKKRVLRPVSLVFVEADVKSPRLG